MRGFDGIERSQRKLFRDIQNELAFIERKTSRDVASYERAYRAGFPRRFQVSSKAELLKAAAKARVVLVGDFHPFRQSQKGFLRLVNESLPAKKKIGVGLECIQQAHQAAVDEFMAGWITLEELREKIEFERYWPFAWSNYREIFELARKHSFRIFALNIPERKRDSKLLRMRDRAAAERIVLALSEDPDLTLFVLYGELHLGRKHLPGDIDELFPTRRAVLTVHQNVPSLYWKVSKQVNSEKAEVLKLGPQEFCLLNSVPWVKLRSYLDWLEGNPEGEEWDREGADLTGSIHQYADLLREALGLKGEPRADLDVHGPDRLKRRPPAKLERGERPLYRHAVDFQRTGYLPGAALLLVPVASTNALSEAAALSLWRSQLSRTQKAALPHGEPLIVQFFIGYLGSKILNPKRKCNEVADLKDFLASMRGKKGSAFERSKKRIYRRALALLDSLLSGRKVKEARLRGPEEVEACRLAAYVLGDRMFLALLKDPNLSDFARRIFTASAASPSWAKHLLAEVVSCLGSHFTRPKRKTDKF